MWISAKLEPPPAVDAKQLIVYLRHTPYYGHYYASDTAVVTAAWDAFQRCFVEDSTGMEIHTRDIDQWWRDD